MANDTYTWLIDLLDRETADYRLVDHPAEGSTAAVSAMRGNPVAQAAKCLMLRAKTGKKTRVHVLAVVPGDRRVDLAAIGKLTGAGYVGFCEPHTAERLARTVPGTVLPFVLDPEVTLFVDPALLKQPSLWFNAARLDRSVELATDDYRRIAAPRLAPISQAYPAVSQAETAISQAETATAPRMSA